MVPQAAVPAGALPEGLGDLMAMFGTAAQRAAGRHNILAAVAAVLVPALTAVPATAQDAPYFSSTYAASEGSPYSSVYARTFGAGGPPAPLETGAAPSGLAPSDLAPSDPAPTESKAGEVVYVIENGRLLTYRAEDFARGGRAVTSTAVPPAPGGAELSGITGRLYGSPPAAPVEDAAGPIPLVPPQD